MRSFFGLSCLMLLVYVATACEPRDEIGVPPAGGQVELRECRHNLPDSLTFYSDGRAITVNTPPGFGGVGLYAEAPELHDCQRFESQGGGAYDSLFAVYAIPDINPPAALIIAWGDYPQLHIAVGFNCLFLQEDPSPGQSWSATMVSYGPVSPPPDCRELAAPAAAPAGGQPLQVADTTYDGLTSPDDYPQVARWDREPNGGQYYIGLACGPAWCEVGNGVARSANFASRMGANAPTDPGLRRITSSKAWYDEQVLAEPGSNGQVPSDLVGTMIPVPDLAQRDSAAFHGNWIQVAWVSLERRTGGGPNPPPNPYLAKANLELTNPAAGLDGLNKIFLCVGSHQECGVPSTEPADCTKIDDAPSDGMWWGRTDNPSGGQRIQCVTRYKLPPALSIIPGTVRWRWIVEDEGSWFRCPQGCCEMIGEL